MKETLYESPFSSRYASKEMSHLFSAEYKFLTWRKLWVALAKGQKALGLNISDEQIASLEKQIANIDFEAAKEHEKNLRHDVMAHVHAFGDSAPLAKGIIHLGATSAFVTDNTDLIVMKNALSLLQAKTIQVLKQLADFSLKYKDLACLSYTHFQAAQPTTVGKRGALWLQDFLLDAKDIEEGSKKIRFLGLKGATGTQASFLNLFDGDSQKVKELENFVAKKMGFSAFFLISSQTYTRKQDVQILSLLNGLAVSSHKFGSDLRLLAHLKELEEPFNTKQVGSSAMPYKRNPVRAERICGLARFLISLCENPSYTAATQWLERTLDDSSNRRLTLPEAFLCADSILNLLIDVTSHMIVYPKMIERHLKEELPFMATENILMEAVKQGKDRQAIHERLRLLTQEESCLMKEEGKGSTLLEKLANDPLIGLGKEKIERLAKAENFTGRSEAQVLEFLKEELTPFLQKHKDLKPPIHPIEL